MACINGLQMGGYSPKLWDLSGRPDFLSCKWGLLGVNDTPERRLKAQPCPVVQSSKHVNFWVLFFGWDLKLWPFVGSGNGVWGHPQNVCSVFKYPITHWIFLGTSIFLIIKKTYRVCNMFSKNVGCTSTLFENLPPKVYQKWPLLVNLPPPYLADHPP